jgi:hypothetical protein
MVGWGSLQILKLKAEAEAAVLAMLTWVLVDGGGI